VSRGRRNSPLNAVVGLGLAAFLIHASGGHVPVPGALAQAGRHAASAVTAVHDARQPVARPAKAIAFAKAQLGKPYDYGAPRWSPGAPVPGSYDCSSLVQWAWAAAGVVIPPTSETQWAQLRHVPLNQLRPGDLVFYTGSSIDAPPGHVVMYLGGGWILEAYGSGYPIRITRLRPGAWGGARPV
jgi:cell wall-associated NlpC family hydrolase